MSNHDGFERQLFPMTTIIYTELREGDKLYSGQATGFFYTVMTPTDPSNRGAQWHRVEGHWLVTNRHAVLSKVKDEECLPDNFSFCFRKLDGSAISWEKIALTREELKACLKLHENPAVDVAVIDVGQYVQQILSSSGKKADNRIDAMLPFSLSNLNLPANQPIVIDVTSDVIVASYPRGFYDDVNKFPIVKSGIVASAWEFNFKGLPQFQIDAQLFPGSSGGLVISKPTHIAMINGSLAFSETKDFVLLGVYSGEYVDKETIEIAGKKIELERSYGLGTVWYSYLIPEIIDHGVKFCC